VLLKRREEGAHGNAVMSLTAASDPGPSASPARSVLDRAPLMRLPVMPEPRPVGSALLRGAMGLCPACGAGRMYYRYLKVADHCPSCSEALYHQRADDAPPYATILVVGHIVVPLMVLVEELYRPPVWLHGALWLPLTLILCLLLLPPLKGMLVNLQWALRMHGFDPTSEEHEARPRPDPAGADLPVPERP